jgi:pimeloyl-ACP methyl ester carboxylesterase
MGGGGTTIAATTDTTLKTSIGLAAWGPVGSGVSVPTLFLCGQSDGTAPCSQSEGAYGLMPETTPKMLVAIPGASHFNWFGPQDAGMGRSGAYALAFQKVFLDGDERWREFLVQAPSSGEFDTNIDP